MRALLVGIVFCVACGESTPELPPCPAGQARNPDNECAYVRPAEPCPVGTFARLSFDTCQPIGPTSVPDAFADDEWGWQAKTASNCPVGTAPFLGETACQPVGWAGCPTGFSPSGAGCMATVPAVPCPGASRAAIGQASCVPLGSCGGAFPPAQATLFVDASFTAGELDSSHFLTIGEALAVAPAGATVAVHAGTYPEQLAIDRGVTVVGQCAEQVLIDGVTIATEEVIIEAVTVTGSGIAVTSSGVAVLDGVLVTGNQTFGLSVAGLATLRSSSVCDTVAAPLGGSGVVVEPGGVLEMVDSEVAANASVGVLVEGAATITGSVIRDTVPADSGSEGFGIEVRGTLDLGQSVVSSNVYWGIRVTGTNASATVTEVEIRDTGAHASREGGSGVHVERGAQVELERVSIEHNTYAAVTVAHIDSRVSVTDSVLSDSILDPAFGFSSGVMAVQSGVAELERCLVEPHPIGLGADLAGQVHASATLVRGEADSAAGVVVWEGLVHLTGVTVVDQPEIGLGILGTGTIDAERLLVLGRPGEAQAAFGVDVEYGGTATIDESAIVGVFGYGLAVTGTGSRALIWHSLVQNTRGSASSYGVGVAVTHGAELEMSESVVDDTHTLGLLTNDEASLTMSHSVVRGSADVDGPYGAGIATYGELAQISDTAVVACSFGGLLLGEGVVDLSRVLVADTAHDPDGGFGHGLYAEKNEAVIADVELRDNANVGMFFNASGAVVSRTLITGNAVGVHLQGDSELLERAVAPTTPVVPYVVVSPDTVFDGNQVRVGTGVLPTPVLPGI